MIFDKQSYCVENVEQNCLSCLNNFSFYCKVRAIDRFEYKPKGERSEPKTIFPYNNLSNKHFFYHFTDKLFFPQVAEQTIYFPLFAELFFHKKPSPLP